MFSCKPTYNVILWNLKTARTSMSYSQSIRVLPYKIKTLYVYSDFCANQTVIG